MSKVLIIGYGYVGSAIGSIFRKNETVIIDPKYTNNKIEDFKNTNFNIVFVCVDTPKNEKFRTLYSVLNKLNFILNTNTVVVCKSTASPNFYEKVKAEFKNIKIIYSPEYLSHRSNITDFKNQEFIILGGDKSACCVVSKILKPRLKKLKKIVITDIKTAALVKYTENAFLATKITFFNEMFNIHKKLKCLSSYNEFANLVGLDKRIGISQTQVPGPDGKFGWGGHCLTKDNFEFQKFSKSKFLDFILKLNKKHRK